MAKRRAFITGITGQDGSYLSEFLLDKGYEVHGLVRQVDSEFKNRIGNIDHIKDKLILHEGDMTDKSRLLEILGHVKPDECYHLGAKSFVYESFDNCSTTLNVNINGTLNILSAINKESPHCKIYFAGTSEMFGKPETSPQSEKTRFCPRSPYGISKVAGFDIMRNYRDQYGIFACTGFLFNHESPRRGGEFVTRKITKTVAQIKQKRENVLILGNLEAKRDWGYAGDYVEAMWLMLQQDAPDDYVVGTGRVSSVGDLVSKSFKYLDLDYEIVDLHDLTKEGADKEIEKMRQNSAKIFVVQHPLYYRPTETSLLIADPTKIKEALGWEPKTNIDELVKMMLDKDL